MQPRCTAVLYHADCRVMPEIAGETVDLVVTSPPYWQIKDYGSPGQIGFGQGLHEYLRDLARVWRECRRVLRDGGRLCVNIGDQFARASLFGRYRVIPLHAEITCQCAEAGFDCMGSIIWRKKTTLNTSGGAVVMGSYPYPPNGVVEIDFEYILLFRKPGTPRRPAPRHKAGSALTRDEWKSWFSGHWEIAGARKRGHDAPFPEEIPRRLIRMFSFPGDTVLDPFLGTGTTAKAALELGRSAVGYEIHAGYLQGAAQRPGLQGKTVTVIVPERPGGAFAPPLAEVPEPRIPDLGVPRPTEQSRPAPRLHTVRAIGPDCRLVLDSGAVVGFLGIEIQDPEAARVYLTERVLKKRVFLRDESAAGGGTRARVILKNRISINAQLVKSGAARKVEPASRR
jgi:modification methylase